MFSVWILWGVLREDGDLPVLYEFATEAERAAFLKGVEEADGWLGYEIRQSGDAYKADTFEEGDEASDPAHAHD